MSKEGLAAYGYEGFFKVLSVSLVPATLDSMSKRREAETTEQHKTVERPFEEILKEKSDRMQIDDAATYQMAGYTRDAQSIFYRVPQREYV